MMLYAVSQRDGGMPIDSRSISWMTAAWKWRTTWEPDTSAVRLHEQSIKRFIQKRTPPKSCFILLKT